ncbi:MAG: hypothetical protein WD577_06945 [Bacteroidales bacterium]
MRQRTTILIIILLLAVAGGYLLLTDPWTTTGRELNNMLLPKGADVSSIVVISGYDTIRFVQKDSVWYLEGEVLNSKAVENLLYAAARLQMTGVIPVSAIIEGGELTEFIFQGKRKMLANFYFGTTGQGDAVFQPGAETGYGVELPGFEDLPLEKVFSSNRDHYRKHLLVSLLPSEVRSVTVIPRSGTSFLAVQDSLYDLEVVDLSGMRNVTDHVDERKVRMLFSYFNAIRYDKVVTDEDVEPGTIPEKPYATVEVASFDDRKWKFEVYQWIKTGSEEPDIFESLVIVNNSLPYRSVNYYYLDLLMRGMESYY